MSRELRPVGDELEAVLSGLGIGGPVDMPRLLSEWPELAGEPWSSRSAPSALEGSTLLIDVPDGSTATLLKYQVSGLIDRLQEALGAGAVTAVRLRVRRP